MPTTVKPADIGTTAALDPTSSGRVWPRRRVLAGSGAALLACAACGSSSTTAPAAPTSGSAGSTAIASVADVPASAGLVVDDPSGRVVLAKLDGRVVAHSAVCTHQGAIIDGAGVCPLHGSQFNVTTGAVLVGPASTPLAVVAVTESGGKVFTA